MQEGKDSTMGNAKEQVALEAILEDVHKPFAELRAFLADSGNNFLSEQDAEAVSGYLDRISASLFDHDDRQGRNFEGYILAKKRESAAVIAENKRALFGKHALRDPFDRGRLIAELESATKTLREIEGEKAV